LQVGLARLEVSIDPLQGRRQLLDHFSSARQGHALGQEHPCFDQVPVQVGEEYELELVPGRHG